MSQTTAIYVRTSTDDNDGSAQLHELRGHVARAESVTHVIEYLDRGESGTKTNRPEWSRLMRDARDGKLACVVATEVSRIGRLGAGQVTQALDELHRLGVRLVLTRQGLDYGTPTGQFVAGILAEVAKLERVQVLERTRAGIARARSRGVKFGRRELAIEPERLTRARELRQAGASWRVAAQAAGVKVRTLRRKLGAS